MASLAELLRAALSRCSCVLPVKMPRMGTHRRVKLAYGAATAMLLTTTYAGGTKFDIYYSNIIILLLGQMAIFGSIIYLCTMYNWQARIVVMACFTGLFLSAKVDGSWAQTFFNWTPIPWMWPYLNYLAYLLHSPRFREASPAIYTAQMDEPPRRRRQKTDTRKTEAFGILAISVGVIVTNLVCLYNRWSFLAWSSQQRSSSSDACS